MDGCGSQINTSYILKIDTLCLGGIYPQKPALLRCRRIGFESPE
jgi:hypothetical protein